METMRHLYPKQTTERKKMKGLIWNCRGIRKTGVSSFLKDLIQEHQFHFIGLQETIVGNLEDHVLAKLDPQKKLPVEVDSCQREIWWYPYWN